MRSPIFFFLVFFTVSLQAQELKTHPQLLVGLVQAVEFDDVAKVRSMVESGSASVDEMVASPPGSDAIHPLIVVAARAGSEKVARYLIQEGCNVNARNNSRETALLMASFFDDSLYGGSGDFTKHDRIAKMLISAGASLENEDWWPPLAYAAYKNRNRIGEYLLQKGAKVDGPVQEGRSPVNTPLMMSVLAGHKSFTLLLLRNGANALILNKKSSTARDIAERNNQTHLISYLKCAESLNPGETFLEKCEN